MEVRLFKTMIGKDTPNFRVFIRICESLSKMENDQKTGDSEESPVRKTNERVEKNPKFYTE